METQENIKAVKAIALLSGGLDSQLAAKLVKDQGVEVIGLHLISPFGCREDVQKVADNLGIRLRFEEKGEKYVDLVEKPKHGYGKAINPCLDCRVFMFDIAKRVMEEENAQFIVTGEVMGQRPLSQHRRAFEIIDNESPTDGLVLRPLCAKRLPPTIAERNGWIAREKLHEITGRGRTDQLKLARELGISEFASPAGGCLLTDINFSRRLKDFYFYKPYETSEQKMKQSELLRVGRHYRVNDEFKMIVARNEAECTTLEKEWPGTGGAFFKPANFLGPSAVAFGKLDTTKKEFVGKVLARYGVPSFAEDHRIAYRDVKTEESFPVKSLVTLEELESYQL